MIDDESKWFIAKCNFVVLTGIKKNGGGGRRGEGEGEERDFLFLCETSLRGKRREKETPPKIVTKALPVSGKVL